jgi:hypothetical protein
VAFPLTLLCYLCLLNTRKFTLPNSCAFLCDFCLALLELELELSDTSSRYAILAFKNLQPCLESIQGREKIDSQTRVCNYKNVNNQNNASVKDEPYGAA